MYDNIKTIKLLLFFISVEIFEKLNNVFYSLNLRLPSFNFVNFVNSVNVFYSLN